MSTRRTVFAAAIARNTEASSTSVLNASVLPAVLLPLAAAILVGCDSGGPLGTCNEAFSSESIWKTGISELECTRECPPYRYDTIVFSDFQTVTTHHISKCEWVLDESTSSSSSIVGPG